MKFAIIHELISILPKQSHSFFSGTPCIKNSCPILVVTREMVFRRLPEKRPQLKNDRMRKKTEMKIGRKEL